jgi:hypothetical protein
MEVARQLARSGEAAYRLLTDETPGFYDYYYETTVVNQIALMNMGSRPARRQVRDFWEREREYRLLTDETFRWETFERERESTGCWRTRLSGERLLRERERVPAADGRDFQVRDFWERERERTGCWTGETFRWETFERERESTGCWRTRLSGERLLRERERVPAADGRDFQVRDFW